MEWHLSEGLLPYSETVEEMEDIAARVAAGLHEGRIWLLEHPPLYTAGTSAKAHDLLHADFPVFPSGRGGQYTYHGPGQRVVYVIGDLKQYGSDIRCFVRTLEQWIIDALAVLGISGFVREGRVGVWVGTPNGEAKIAAIGVRVRRWVSLHGFALNICPDLAHYSGIIPCGLAGFGVTSLHALGKKVTMETVDIALKETNPFLQKRSLAKCSIETI